MNKTNMKQHLRRTFSALAIIGALFTLSQARAGQPAPMHGYSTDCENLISLHTVGPNTIIVLDETATFTGTFTGTSVGTERDVIHADGSGTLQASHVFTGSVNLNGSVRSGTMTISLVVTFAPNGTEVTRWVVDQGTGDLAGISGQGTTPSAEELGPTEDCAWDRFTVEWAGQIQFAR
jgi:hypothetical protein